MKSDWENTAIEYALRGMGEEELHLGYLKVLKLSKDWTQGPNPLNILDYGCGSGKFSRELARRGMKVTAVDPTPKMIELALMQDSYNIDYYCTKDLSFIPSDSLDEVVSTFVFCGIDEDLEILRILTEIKRVLKLNAPIIILDPHPLSHQSNYASGFREIISGRTVKAMLNHMKTPVYDTLRQIPEYVNLFEQSGFFVDQVCESDQPPQYLILRGVKR